MEKHLFANRCTSEARACSREDTSCNRGRSHHRSALHNHRVLTISNVNSDERTAPLVEHYFAPKQIYARLDAAIIVDGFVQGLVSFEHCFTPREWSPEKAYSVEPWQIWSRPSSPHA